MPNRIIPQPSLQPPAPNAPSQEWVGYIKDTQIISPVVQPLMDRLAEQPIVGKGDSKLIYDLAPGKVVALLKHPQSKEDLTASFYARKLVHEFLPGYVPAVYWTAVQPGMLAMQKAEGINAQRAYKSLRREGPDEKDRARKRIDKAISGTRFVLGQLGIQIDEGPGNFAINKDNIAVYLGDPELEDNALLKMREAAKWLPGSRRTRAERFLKALEAVPKDSPIFTLKGITSDSRPQRERRRSGCRPRP